MSLSLSFHLSLLTCLHLFAARYRFFALSRLSHLTCLSLSLLSVSSQ